MKGKISKIHYSAFINTGNPKSDFRRAEIEFSVAGIDVIERSLDGYISFHSKQIDVVEDLINSRKIKANIKNIHIFSREGGGYAIDAKINGVKVGPEKISREDVNLGFDGKQRELAIKYLINPMVRMDKTDEQYNTQYMRVSRNIIREHSTVPYNSNYLTTKGFNRTSIAYDAYLKGLISNMDKRLKLVKSSILKRAEKCIADNKQNKQTDAAELTKGHKY